MAPLTNDTANNNGKPPSRKRPPSNSISAASPDRRKRTRLTTARTIASQSPALSSGSLDLASFIRSREFEIKALTQAMANSKAASSKRAFQSVPRDMRRRTASHNPARVPQRLRKRAVHEMKEDNTPVHTMRNHKKGTRNWLRAETARRLRKAAKKEGVVEALIKGREPKDAVLKRPPRGDSKFRKRQKGKTWLPAHVWHAKRAHMSIKWGFAIAESCNEKSFRATARAVDDRGAVAWDTSYLASMLVRGEEAAVEHVLGKLGVKQPCARKVRDGSRVLETWMYAAATKPIAPAVVLWDPVSPDASERRVLVRVHPAAFTELWTTLTTAAKQAATKVVVEDLRFELASIQITGPASTDALLAVLTPDDDNASSASSASASARLWSQLHGLTSPAALPPGALLSFTVSDPRLRFPPRAPQPPAGDAASRLHQLALHWPVSCPAAPFDLLHPRPRSVAVRLQPSQKRINARKGAAPPGSFAAPLPADPSIPLILFSTATPTPCSPAPVIPTWNLLLPWKYLQPTWYALMHAPAPHRVRFGGLAELRQTHFNAGVAYFPVDFPGTVAGRISEDERADRRRKEWERRPPAKRLNFDVLRVGGKKGEKGEKGEHGDWSRCDWGLLMPKPSAADVAATVAAHADAMETNVDPSPAASAESLLCQALPGTLPSPLAVTTVKITLQGRGAPSDCARVYRIPADPESPWRKLLPSNQRRKNKKKSRKGKERAVGDDDDDDDEEGEGATHPECPGIEDLLGFVTTGNYSLKEGRSVAVAGLVLGERGGGGGQGGEERWCVVRDVGSRVGRVGRWEGV